ncbi:MAG: peptide chain release factor N(5)-glutamine methyltransferase [Pseudomonadales bacterium]|nr:peptide chain release factor N(5)-glutamine methyltransferase [Pseudomonadales bacterium]
MISKDWALAAVSDTPELEVRWMLEDLLDKPASYLSSHSDTEIEPALFQRFQELLARRLKGEPLAYILGHWGFWSLDLIVSPTTLIPRPETELLVELAIQLYGDQSDIHALDLGTGTGAIALAIASERPDWQITATDQSTEIIEAAQSNALRNAIRSVQFKVGGWYQALENDTGSQTLQFDLIISNPPYIEYDDPHLGQGDVRFEPTSALVANDDGLADLREIIDNAEQYLKPSGRLLVEHGYQQGESVRKLFLTAGFSEVETRRDLAGHERVTLGRLAPV